MEGVNKHNAGCPVPVIFGSDHNGLLYKGMESLLERLSAARTRLNGLFEDRTRTTAAMEALKAQIGEGFREADVLKARVKELEQENEVLRTAKAAVEQPAREGAKEQIDELVNEIDRCLALLNA